MTTASDLTSLLRNVRALAKYPFKDADERSVAMRELRAASDDLQGTYDKLIEMWGAPSKDAALKTCIDVDLFSKWKTAEGQRTSAELADMTGMEPQLMSAILKHLAAWHIIDENGPDLYQLSNFAVQLARPEVAGCVQNHFDVFIPMFYNLPVYLASSNYKRPTDPKWAPLSFAKHFHGNYFEYMKVDRQTAASFDLTMQGYTADRASWLVPYPAAEELLVGADLETPVLVDVGGGLGHDLEKFHQQQPNETKNRLVLQEQPQTIEKAMDLTPEIRKMAHDFFTEQPIKGARAYFMHSILHDWPDHQAREILENLKPALKLGYSKILINEIVVPSENASQAVTCFDFIMMGCGGGRERDESTWKELIESAGLRISKIWASPSAIESVIEVTLP